MKFCSVFAALVLASCACHAGVINFNGLSGSFATYTEQGVTFSPIGGGLLLAMATPNTTVGLIGDNTTLRQEIRADISGGATSVAIDLGDLDQDPDTLFLEIFNSSNVSLGFNSLLTTAADITMHTLSLSAANIAYAVFGARAPAANGSSTFADNFTFSAPAPVPEPGTFALLAAGIVAFALGRRTVLPRR